VQLLFWWVRAGKRALAAWPDAYRPLAYGHLIPILLWFALPKRLFYFFWYLSPANADQSNHGFLPGLSPYWSALETDYHANPAWFPIVVGLFVLAVIGIRGLRPGAAAILVFVVISALLTLQHPMAKNRFLHSWVACLWVAAGIGLIQGLRIAFKLWPRQASWAYGLVAALFVGSLGGAFFKPGHAQEGGLRLDRPTTLALARVYLPELKHSRDVALFCNVQTNFELRWTYLEAFRRTRNLTTEIKGYDPKITSAEMVAADWLAATKTDAVVVLDVPKTSPLYTPSPMASDVQPILRALENQNSFMLSRYWRLEHGETIELWSRTATADLSLVKK
jgi:hypothetical protein